MSRSRLSIEPTSIAIRVRSQQPHSHTTAPACDSLTRTRIHTHTNQPTNNENRLRVFAINRSFRVSIRVWSSVSFSISVNIEAIPVVVSIIYYFFWFRISFYGFWFILFCFVDEVKLIIFRSSKLFVEEIKDRIQIIAKLKVKKKKPRKNNKFNFVVLFFSSWKPNQNFLIKFNSWSLWLFSFMSLLWRRAHHTRILKRAGKTKHPPREDESIWSSINKIFPLRVPLVLRIRFIYISKKTHINQICLIQSSAVHWIFD